MRNFKFVVLASLALVLSACSFDGMYEKMIPESVRAMDDSYIQALLDEDIEPFKALQGEMSDEDFEKTIGNLFDGIPEGEVTDRSVVGVQTSTSMGAGGKSKHIQNMFELKKGDKFLLVTLDYGLDKNKDCCRLINFQSYRYDQSPVKASIEMAGRIAKIIGLVILFGLLALIFWLIRRRRKKRA